MMGLMLVLIIAVATFNIPLRPGDGGHRQGRGGGHPVPWAWSESGIVKIFGGVGA